MFDKKVAPLCAPALRAWRTCRAEVPPVRARARAREQERERERERERECVCVCVCAKALAGVAFQDVGLGCTGFAV